jgi:hypothetical protein
MEIYSRVFEPGLKTAIFSPGFSLPVRYPGVKGVANRERDEHFSSSSNMMLYLLYDVKFVLFA